MTIPKQLALSDPSTVFAAPEEVRDSPEFTSSEKSEILRRWAYEVAEMAVALEEGMPEAGHNDLQRRILLALGALAGDLENTGPTKQHGLPVTPTPRKLIGPDSNEKEGVGNVG